MARPREFDYETALEGAMQIFWEQGYAATNLPDLLMAMGLTRGSFYKAFEDKRSTYLEALDYYDRKVVSKTVRLLAESKGQPVAIRLSTLFPDEPQLGPNGRRHGCFICNAMVELGPTDQQVAKLTSAMSGRLHHAILAVLQDAKLPVDQMLLEAKASAILHLYFGAQAMAKANRCDQNWQILLEDLLASCERRSQ